MPNTTLNTCVKYVNNQRINHGITGAYTITENLRLVRKHLVDWLQQYFMNQSNRYSSTNISTYVTHIIDLLNKSFTHNPQHLLLEPLFKESER